ncbi:MAG: 30S ribosomal protein S6 [Endomicrobium sp.]|jgi:small subunit ribosomal protein S6|nr:30S ribosomal protein S6 [Endomicrobium sp.]
MNYESTFIVSTELPADKVEQLIAKAVKTIEAVKGTVKVVQQLGKKKLAYPINKLREGNYVYMELSGEGSMISSLESFFKLNDSVIRFLTVKIEKKKKFVKLAVRSEQAVENLATEVKNGTTK